MGVPCLFGHVPISLQTTAGGRAEPPEGCAPNIVEGISGGPDRAEVSALTTCLIWVSRQRRMNVGDVTTRYGIEVIDAAVYDYVGIARRGENTC
jgi:hypothetical protein